MQITYKKSASKFLKSTDKVTATKILYAINGLTKVPPEGDIKVLQGRIDEYRLRVGKYRVIYGYENNNIVILDIGSRGDIYK